MVVNAKSMIITVAGVELGPFPMDLDKWPKGRGDPRRAAEDGCKLCDGLVTCPDCHGTGRHAPRPKRD